MIQDWRGQFFEYESFKSGIVLSDEDLRAVQAADLHLFPTNNDNIYVVQSAFFLNLILHCGIYEIQTVRSFMNKPSAGSHPCCFKKCRKLQYFQKLLQLGHYLPKNLANDIRLGLLGCRIFGTPRPRVLSESFEEECKKETKEVCRKIYIGSLRRATEICPSEL